MHFTLALIYHKKVYSEWNRSYVLKCPNFKNNWSLNHSSAWVFGKQVNRPKTHRLNRVQGIILGIILFGIATQLIWLISFLLSIFNKKGSLNIKCNSYYISVATIKPLENQNNWRCLSLVPSHGIVTDTVSWCEDGSSQSQFCSLHSLHSVITDQKR